MVMVPKEPNIMLSFVNTKLRDFYVNLEAMCEDLELERTEIEKQLKGIGYTYDEKSNRFI